MGGMVEDSGYWILDTGCAPGRNGVEYHKCRSVGQGVTALQPYSGLR